MGALRTWLAPNLGTVEGDIIAPLPADVMTLARPLASFSPLRLALFILPLLAALLSLRRAGRLATLSVLVGTLNIATLTVIVLGDGLADVSKQGHLIFNASLCWCFAAPLLLAGQHRSTTQTRPPTLREFVVS